MDEPLASDTIANVAVSEEIEVTPEMLKAGVAALLEYVADLIWVTTIRWPMSSAQ